MWVTRARLGSALEWALAAGCILALAALASLITHEFRAVRTFTAVLADQAGVLPTVEAPATVPAGAVSVPLLLLSNGAQLQVGQTASDIAARISAAWQIGTDAIERTTRGQRVTRSYDDGARRFLLVFEGPERGTDSRIAAIFLL